MNLNLLIGKTYEDPEGIWEVIAVDDKNATIVNIQEGNIEYGFEFMVEIEQALYYLRDELDMDALDIDPSQSVLYEIIQNLV